MLTNRFDFSKVKVFVYGDVMIDYYWHGTINRISPEAPVPIMLHKANSSVIGGAGNVANNIKALGGSVSLSGFVGIDENAGLLNDLCVQVGIEHAFISVPGQITTKKLRLVSGYQQLFRVDFENSPAVVVDAEELWQQNAAYLESQISQADVVVLSDYLKGANQLIPHLIQAARKLGKPVILDPKGKNYQIYRGAHLLTPNLSEFTEIAGQYGFTPAQVQEQEAQIAAFLIQELQLQAGLLITKSEKGITLYLADGTIYNQPTQARQVFDVTGAGDTVVATLAAAFASGHTWQESCYIANKAAGISVSKPSTATVSLEELEQACHQTEPANFALAELLDRLKQARANGERIVFTNGCFDILHKGHLTYLAQAKQLGDFLVVGVNSDASVKRLKGESRPVNQLDDRMLMLSSLKFVDYVVSFDEDTPLELIKAIMPDVLVKGGDYKVEDIVGYQEVIANGGSVQTIDFVPNYSTTKLISEINSKK